jgi:hypothetical protein
MSNEGESHALSKRGARILGLFAGGTGLLIVLVAAGVIPADERSFGAPRWVVGAAGMAFVLAGLAIVTMPIGRPGAPADQATPWSLLLGGSIVGLLALIFNWIAFGPGERRFSGGVALPFFWVSSSRIGEWTGRLVFGGGAVVIDLFFVWAMVRGVRQLLRARREREGS